jgi:hypothetical protein
VVMMNYLKFYEGPFQQIEDLTLDRHFSHHTKNKKACISTQHLVQWAIFNDCFQACNNRASAAEVRRPQHLNLPQTHHNPTKHRAGGLRLTPT